MDTSRTGPIPFSARAAALKFLEPAAVQGVGAARRTNTSQRTIGIDMKKALTIALALSASIVLGTHRPSAALSPETTMRLDLLKTKEVIEQEEVADFTRIIKEKTSANTDENHHHAVQSLADRVERLAETNEKSIALNSSIQISGLVEAELITSREKDVNETTSSSDLSLATAQLIAKAEVNQYVSGNLTFLYEETNDNDTINIDEAIITLKGDNNNSLYINIGRQYLPFGRFKSHFITDPGTLILGETNDTAVVAGYASEIMDLNIGVFKGTIRENNTGDRINSAVASLSLSIPNTEEDRLSLSCGGSYLSHLTNSDNLEDESIHGTTTDTVGGWSTFISLSYNDRLFLDGEYLGATKDFAIDDFNFSSPENMRPGAWNIEAAARVLEGTEFALRYGASKEAGSLLAQDEYGAALLYNIFQSTNLTIEYLYQKYSDYSSNNQGTVQVAVEF